MAPLDRQGAATDFIIDLTPLGDFTHHELKSALFFSRFFPYLNVELQLLARAFLPGESNKVLKPIQNQPFNKHCFGLKRCPRTESGLLMFGDPFI